MSKAAITACQPATGEPDKLDRLLDVRAALRAEFGIPMSDTERRIMSDLDRAIADLMLVRPTTVGTKVLVSLATLFRNDDDAVLADILNRFANGETRFAVGGDWPGMLIERAPRQPIEMAKFWVTGGDR